MRRFILLAFLLFSFLAIQVQAQTATVVAWNLKGFDPIPNSQAETYAKAIGKLRPDVIVLIEVNPDTIATAIKNELNGYKLVILPQTASQNIAVLFKNTVSVTHPRLIENSDDDNSKLRKALAVDVTIAKFDFILIGLHMKASRPQDLDDPDDPHNVRNRQARAIARFISDETSGGEKDILVVGDYNMVPGEDNPNFRAMSPGTGAKEFLRYVSTESVIGQVSHISNCSGGKPRGNLLDGFAVSKKFTKEYVEGSTILIKPNDAIFTSGTPLSCSKYLSRFSDHLPILSRFRTNKDDDN